MHLSLPEFSEEEWKAILLDHGYTDIDAPNRVYGHYGIPGDTLWMCTSPEGTRMACSFALTCIFKEVFKEVFKTKIK